MPKYKIYGIHKNISYNKIKDSKLTSNTISRLAMYRYMFLLSMYYYCIDMFILYSILFFAWLLASKSKHGRNKKLKQK